MTPRRRGQFLLAGASAIAVVIALALTLNRDHHDRAHVPTATAPKSIDPYARDRIQIENLARAYQAALNPASTTDPCSYLDPITRREKAEEFARGTSITLPTRSCAKGLRAAASVATSTPLYKAQPQGIDANSLNFDPTGDSVEGLTVPRPLRHLPRAEALWAGRVQGAGFGGARFIKKSGRWWVTE